MEKRYLVFIFIALLSVLCMAFIYMGTTYTAVFFAGLVLFLLLGLTGSAAFYTSMCRMKTEQYLARTVGISYALGILLQFEQQPDSFRACRDDCFICVSADSYCLAA